MGTSLRTCAKASEGGDTAVEHTNAYMCVCRCLCACLCVCLCVICVFVCVFVCVCVDVSHAPAERQISAGAVKKSETPCPLKRVMTVQK